MSPAPRQACLTLFVLVGLQLQPTAYRHIVHLTRCLRTLRARRALVRVSVSHIASRAPQLLLRVRQFDPRVVAVIPDPRAARSLRFARSRTVDGYHPSILEQSVITRFIDSKNCGRASPVKTLSDPHSKRMDLKIKSRDNPLGWRVLKGLKLKTNRQPSNQNPNPSTLTLIPNKILSHLLCGAKINKMVEFDHVTNSAFRF